MTTDYLLGIDAGTTVIKSALFDLTGQQIGQGIVETPVQYPHPTWAELDMMAVWQGVVESIQQLLQSVDTIAPEAIRAVGITGQGDGTWLVDAQHRPVRPAILWLDGRCADSVRELQAAGIDHDFYQITGTVLNTSNQAVHLKWLEQNEAESLNNAHAALRAKDWIFLNLTGQISTDESDASYTYFSLKDRHYDDKIWDLLNISRWRPLAPPALPAAKNSGELLPNIATQLGLKAGLPVVAGPFDAVAVAVGVGALADGAASTVLGTAGIHQISLAQPNSNPQNVGYTMCHAPEDRWMRLLPTMSCTQNLQWCVDQFFEAEIKAAEASGENVWDRLAAIAAAAPAGSNGVMYHPYIDPAGERTPFVQSNARAQFTGIDSHNSKADLLRAVYEGVMLSALDCYAYLPSKLDSLKLAGGGARSSLWAQIFADGLGCPVSIVEGDEFGAKGAAMNAGVAVGLYASFDDAAEKSIHPGKIYEPDAEKTEIYRTLAHRYRQTYEAMLPLWEGSATAA